MRTIQQALEHAKQQARYPLRDAPDLISDFILLAEEVARLRCYTCRHPIVGRPSAFVSKDIADAVFGQRMEFEGSPVLIDTAMTAGDGIHFPQPDGSCIHYAI